MDIKRAQYLLEGYHNNTLDVQENNEFTLLLQDPGLEDLRTEWLNGYWDIENDFWSKLPVPDEGRLLNHIYERPILKPFFKRRKATIAAALATLFIASSIFLVNSYYYKKSQLTDFDPGKYQASMIIGRDTIAFEPGHQGIIMGHRLRYADGSLVKLMEKLNKQALPITLLVPAGGTYKVKLMDGTEVWLNADSKLTYPSEFNEQSREVYLEGEAFFKVSKQVKQISGQSQRIPFLVKTKKQTVSVLGTQFNLSAYPDEKQTSTTLFEGSVKVIPNPELKKQHREFLLTPGQSSVVSEDSLVLSKKIKNQTSAWKDGYFDFTDMNIEQVMRQLARWYNLEITIEGKVPDLKFYGTIERNNRLSTILTLLETNDLGYRIDGRKLTVFTNKTKKGGLEQTK